MHHKFLGMLAVSMLLPGFVLSHQPSARADNLNQSPIIVQGGKDKAVLWGDGSVRSSVQTPGSLVQLNPQPLPPGSLVRLNPQPLPPARSYPGRFVQLNPQPEPLGYPLDLKLR